MEINNRPHHNTENTWWDDNDDGNLASLRFLHKPVNFDNIDAIVSHKLRNTPDNISILDIACSTNTFTKGREKIDLEVIGIYFDGMTSNPNKRETISIKQFVGCNEKLPFESDSFDFVCCHYPLPCAEDFQKILEEIPRVLKQSGIFFVNNFSKSSTSNHIVYKILQEWKGAAFSDSSGSEFNLSIGPKGFVKILNDHYLCNHGEYLSPEINYSFHYCNLRKKSIEKECSHPYQQHPGPLPQPLPQHSGEFL